MSFDPMMFEPILNRNAELYKQAKAKASQLDDGSEVGRLKGKLVLALDNFRKTRLLVSWWSRFANDENKYCSDQYVLAQVDEREAKDTVVEIGMKLEDLGVTVKLRWCDSYQEQE